MADTSPPNQPESDVESSRASSSGPANAGAEIESPGDKDRRESNPLLPPMAAGQDSGVGQTWRPDDSAGASYAWLGGGVQTTNSQLGPVVAAMPAELSPSTFRTVPRDVLTARPSDQTAGGTLPPHSAASPHMEQRIITDDPTRLPYEFEPYRAPISASSVLHFMQKWKISFSGKKGEDVDAFLTRIAEGRALIPVSEADLIRCIPFFLTGVALQWFRNDSTSWTSWRHFESACRIRFGDPDYQYALREEIMRRTQGLNEPVADYLTCIRGLFARLQPPWDEPSQVHHLQLD